MKNFENKLSATSIVRGLYPPIYVSDLEQAMQWYCSILRYRVLTYNPNYATMELAPGLFCFMNKNNEKSGTGYCNIFIPDTVQVYQHLVDHGVDVGPLNEEKHATWFTFRDPDGNEYSVSGGIFGVDHIDYNLKPEHQRFSKWGFTYTQMPQIHCIGLKVSEHDTEPSVDDLQAATERLENVLKGIKDVKPGTFCVHQTTRFLEKMIQRNYYLCKETKNFFTPPEGFAAFTIDAQPYAVFEYFLSNPNYRESIKKDYFWSNRHFGNTNVENGHVNALLLEFVRDDSIEVYCPITAKQSYVITD